MANLLFYLMAVTAVLFAVGVVAFRNPVASVISLLGSFFCLATIYLLAGFQFLAMTQILVYAGAILVLFLFVIMLLNLADEAELQQIDKGLLNRRRLGPILAIPFALMTVALLAARQNPFATAAPRNAGAEIDSAAGLGAEIFTRYLLPFEAVSLLLLATAVAVLVLAKRERGRPAARSLAATQGASVALAAKTTEEREPVSHGAAE